MKQETKTEPRTYPARGSRERLTEAEYQNEVLLSYVQQLKEKESAPAVQNFKLGKDIVKKFNHNLLAFGALSILFHTTINILILKRFLADRP